jgi:hypothetical protein
MHSRVVFSNKLCRRSGEALAVSRCARSRASKGSTREREYVHELCTCGGDDEAWGKWGGGESHTMLRHNSFLGFQSFHMPSVLVALEIGPQLLVADLTSTVTIVPLDCPGEWIQPTDRDRFRQMLIQYLAKQHRVALSCILVRSQTTARRVSGRASTGGPGGDVGGENPAKQ